MGAPRVGEDFCASNAAKGGSRGVGPVCLFVCVWVCVCVCVCVFVCVCVCLYVVSKSGLTVG
jgi:hypothetical protein